MSEPFIRLPGLLSAREIDAVVRGYSDAQLAENYRAVSGESGTEWHRVLSAEIGRRDAFGGRPGAPELTDREEDPALCLVNRISVHFTWK